MQNLKVQFPDLFSLQAHVAANISTREANERDMITTIHAFSDEMKARVLEEIAAGTNVLVVSTDEEPKRGDWLEERMATSV